MTITVSPTKTQETRTYSVKVMNQGRKSEYTMQKMSLNQFTTLEEMKQSLTRMLKFPVENFGYIEPGHGLRGRQQWMVQDGDLHEMYKSYNKRREILLWCVRPSARCGTNHPGSDSRKRNGSAGPSEASQPPKVRRTTCSQKIKDVEGIMEQLKEKHGQRYITEQLSCWAHLYHMEKHGSLEVPPNLPFFSGSKKKTAPQEVEQPPTPKTSVSTQPTGQAQSLCVGISPTKRVNLRSESIKQLVDWHSLLEKGGISKEQYDDMQQAILKDMKDNMV